MKVVVLVGGLSGGGAERTLLRVASGLDARGHGVRVLSMDSEGPLERLVRRGVEVEVLNGSRARHCLGQVVRTLRNYQADIILASQHYLNTLSIIAASLARIRLKVVIREANVFSHHLLPKRGLQAAIQRKLIRILYPRADCVIAVSEALAREVTSRLGVQKERVRVVYNGPIDSDFCARLRAPLPRELLALRSKPLIVSVARLVAQKNHSLLLRSFARANEHLRAHLCIVGDGPKRARLEELAFELNVTEHVTFTGFLENPYPILREADVFALSSNYEGMPSALIEALAAGCEVVATDCMTGPSEVLDFGRYGRLVPVDDEEAFARGLIDAFHPGRRRNAVPQEAVSRFTFSQMLDRYEEALLWLNRS